MKPDSQPNSNIDMSETMIKRYFGLFSFQPYDLNFKLINGMCDTIIYEITIQAR